MIGTTLVEKTNIYAKAISDSNRMKILKILGSSPEDTVSVCDIARILNLSQPAVSKHLQVLSWCGLLNRKKISNTVYYSLNKDTIEDFKTVTTMALQMVWSPCNFNYNCEECPHKETCR